LREREREGRERQKRDTSREREEEANEWEGGRGGTFYSSIGHQFIEVAVDVFYWRGREKGVGISVTIIHHILLPSAAAHTYTHNIHTHIYCTCKYLKGEGGGGGG
jgi:hypothetical protein